MGPSLLPCITPELISNSLDNLPFTEILALFCGYRSLITLNILPVIPFAYTSETESVLQLYQKQR